MDLETALKALKSHERELRDLGVQHAGVFGSVVRGDTHPGSDIDVLIDLDPNCPIGVFAYSRLKLYISNLLGEAGDIVNRKNLKPLLRDNILRECVNAF